MTFSGKRVERSMKSSAYLLSVFESYRDIPYSTEVAQTQECQDLRLCSELGQEPSVKWLQVYLLASVASSVSICNPNHQNKTVNTSPARPREARQMHEHTSAQRRYWTAARMDESAYNPSPDIHERPRPCEGGPEVQKQTPKVPTRAGCGTGRGNHMPWPPMSTPNPHHRICAFDRAPCALRRHAQ